MPWLIAELLHSPVECAATESQLLRGYKDISLIPAQRFTDQLAFHISKTGAHEQLRRRSRRGRQSQIRHIYNLACTEIMTKRALTATGDLACVAAVDYAPLNGSGCRLDSWERPWSICPATPRGVSDW